MRRHALRGLICLSLVFPFGCKSEVKGPPAPKVDTTEPNLVCIEQLSTEVTLHGQSFAPMMESGLDSPHLFLPKVELIHSGTLDGAAGSGTVTVLPDDPTKPETSHVHWQSKEQMSISVDPSLALADGVYDVRVTNGDGKSNTTAAALVGVPRPTIASVEPQLVCTSEGASPVLIRGTGFLFTPEGGPVATMNGVDTDVATYADSDCVALPGPRADSKRCTAITVMVPATVGTGTFDITVTNPAPAACASTDTVTLEAVAEGPLVVYADPPVIYDGFPNTLTIFGANFTSGDITSAELLSAGGDTVTLCDDAGSTACDSLSAGQSGFFKVTVPANSLASVSGAPTEATFDLVVTAAGDACPGVLPDAVRIVSVATAADLEMSPAFGQTGVDTAVTITMKTPPAPDGLFVSTPRAYLSSGNAGGALVAVAFSSVNELKAVVPKDFALTGSLDLTVVNPDGTLFQKAGAFTLSTFAPPRIEGVTPGQLPAQSGRQITVTGSSFQTAGAGATASFGTCKTSAGGTPTAVPVVTGTTVVSDTELTVNVDASNATDVYCVLEVTNPQDGAIDQFSAIVIGNSSGNIPQPQQQPFHLFTARAEHGAQVGRSTRASPFLYVAGGIDTDGNALASMEYAPLALTGEPSADFVETRYPLDTARAGLGLVRVDNALYAIGGADSTGTATTVVERAVVLDPRETPTLTLSSIELGSATDPGLTPGIWTYKVAIVYAPTDPISPCGESLPSEPFVINVPDVPDGLHMVLGWSEANVTNLGSRFAGREVAGYRLYRTPEAGQGLNDLVVLTDVDGGTTTTFTDGASTTIAATSSCAAPSVAQPPLAEGETSKWVPLTGGLALKQARKLAGTVAVADRDSTHYFLYAVSGLDAQATPAALDDYELLVLDYDPTKNPSAWETGSWSRTTGVFADSGAGGGCSGTQERSEAGLSVLNRDNSSIDAVNYAINKGVTAQFLALGPGRRTSGGICGDLDSWLITGGTGVLVNHTNGYLSQATRAGYGNIAANKQIFTFGGSPTAPKSIKAVEWFVDSASSPTTLTFDTTFSDNGSSMQFEHNLHASALDRAFIYITGGYSPTAADVTDNVEYGIW